jgi:hypothetical protein
LGAAVVARVVPRWAEAVAALAVRLQELPAVERRLGIALMQKRELLPVRLPVSRPSLRAVFEEFAPDLAV